MTSTVEACVIEVIHTASVAASTKALIVDVMQPYRASESSLVSLRPIMNPVMAVMTIDVKMLSTTCTVFLSRAVYLKFCLGRSTRDRQGSENDSDLRSRQERLIGQSLLRREQCSLCFGWVETILQTSLSFQNWPRK